VCHNAARLLQSLRQCKGYLDAVFVSCFDYFVRCDNIARLRSVSISDRRVLKVTQPNYVQLKYLHERMHAWLCPASRHSPDAIPIGWFANSSGEQHDCVAACAFRARLKRRICPPHACVSPVTPSSEPAHPSLTRRTNRSTIHHDHDSA